jgi:DNA-binding transcriptional LysR family regulator
VPHDHPLAGRKRVDIADLRDETFISGTSNDPNRIALETACATTHFAPQVAYETIDYAVTATLVAKGFGIALVPRLIRSTNNQPLTRIAIHANQRQLTRQISLAYRVGEHSPLIFELLDQLRTKLPRPPR